MIMQNNQEGSDFWNYPDWSGGDNLRSGAEPFWMLPPLVKEKETAIPPVFDHEHLFHVLPGEKIENFTPIKLPEHPYI